MRKFVIPVALTLGLAPADAMDYAKTTETTVNLGHGLYAIIATNPDPSSGIGDTTVAVGRDALIVVDTQFAQLHDMLKSKITAISPLPVKYAINSHFHGDHSGGNAAFAKDGAIIVAHENALKAMVAGRTTPNQALPAQTYSGHATEISIPGQKAELLHTDPAHTSGDTIVVWPGADVISTGDVMHKPGYPNIDNANGGSIDGMIAAANFVIAHCGPNTRIVPGHGDVTDRAGATEYRNMLVTARDRISKAKAQGMSEDQVAKANLLADLDKYWKIRGNGASERFPINVYRGLK